MISIEAAKKDPSAIKKIINGDLSTGNAFFDKKIKELGRDGVTLESIAKKMTADHLKQKVSIGQSSRRGETSSSSSKEPPLPEGAAEIVSAVGKFTKIEDQRNEAEIQRLMRSFPMPPQSKEKDLSSS